MHTEQSERVKLAEGCQVSRDVYARRKREAATLAPGDRVTQTGTVRYTRSGFVTIDWDDGHRTVDWLGR